MTKDMGEVRRERPAGNENGDSPAGCQIAERREVKGIGDAMSTDTSGLTLSFRGSACRNLGGKTAFFYWLSRR